MPEPAPTVTLPMRVAFLYSYFWISKNFVNGFKISFALLSLMSAYYEQIRSQNTKKEKDWTDRKEKTTRNEIKGTNEKENEVLKIVVYEIMLFFRL